MLMVIELSKSKQREKLMETVTKPYIKAKGMAIVTTTPDNNNEFKKSWQLLKKNISKKK